MGSGLATPGGHIGATVGAVRGLKDPRDPRPRAERERMAEHIMAFCAAHQHHVTQRELLTPTGPQFESIFKFLVGLYDPAIRLSPVGGGGGGGQGGAGGRDKNAGAKLADEVMQTLRLVQYPFADSITKSHLQAVGSQQSWPNMLAMLDWFVKVIEVRSLALPPLSLSLQHSSPPPTDTDKTTSRTSPPRPASTPLPQTSSCTSPRPTLPTAPARTSSSTRGSPTARPSTPSSSLARATPSTRVTPTAPSRSSRRRRPSARRSVRPRRDLTLFVCSSATYRTD